MKQFIVLSALSVVVLTSPALALDINSFRAQHKLPALSVSGALSGWPIVTPPTWPRARRSTTQASATVARNETE
jgi:hypothetical protein